MWKVYEECQANLRDGCQVHLIVPDRVLAGTCQNTEIIEPGRISVESIEAFVRMKIDRISAFQRDKSVRR